MWKMGREINIREKRKFMAINKVMREGRIESGKTIEKGKTLETRKKDFRGEEEEENITRKNLHVKIEREGWTGRRETLIKSK